MSSPKTRDETEPLGAPVAFLVFNRPTYTERVLERIRLARPRRLYVVADGPRAARSEDAARCAAVRSLIADGVNWPCEVRTNFAPVNLGCRERVSTGVEWVFSQESEAIFLEDDCLPDPSFFGFCSELLALYRDNKRVGQICGSLVVAPRISRGSSYIFSRYGPVWGWASWRRAWKTYDIHMTEWPRLREAGWLSTIARSRREVDLRRRIYDDLRAGKIDTWDYQWGFAKLVHGLLSVIPTVNLIENIGAGPDATHPEPYHRSNEALSIGGPLIHPRSIVTDDAYDTAFSNHIAPSFARRTIERVKRYAGL